MKFCKKRSYVTAEDQTIAKRHMLRTHRFQNVKAIHIGMLFLTHSTSVCRIPDQYQVLFWHWVTPANRLPRSYPQKVYILVGGVSEGRILKICLKKINWIFSDSVKRSEGNSKRIIHW